MMAAIRHGLANLANFDGRDSRRTFWLYVLGLFIVYIVLGLIATVPFMASMMNPMIAQVQAGGDEQQAINAMMNGMAEGMKTQTIISAVLSAVMFALFAAAFVRRLHDSGKTGWIALIPLMTTTFGLVFAFTRADEIISTMQSAIAANDLAGIQALESSLQRYSMIGLLGYLVVIGFGVLKSTEGPNQYGDEPAEV